MSKKIKIVLAENHHLFRDLLNPVLGKHGIETIGEAENGIELLELLKSVFPDIILLDISMPKMNGSDALVEIIKLYPNISVIILTRHNDKTLINHFLKIGAKAFVSKDSDSMILIQTINDVFTKSAKSSVNGSKENSTDANTIFSKRELELVPLICEGKSNKEIAEELHVDIKTVEAHKKKMFLKTNSKGVVNFVRFAIQRGLNYLR